MFDAIFKYLRKEGAVIRDSPVAFCTLLISGLLLGWFIIGAGLELFHREKMEASNIRTDYLLNLVDEYQEKAGETPELAREKINELRGKITALEAGTAVSLQTITPPAWQKFGDERLVLGAGIHITSKFQRSGLLINIKDADIKKVEVTELFGKVVGGEIKSRKPGHRSYYINKPSGMYFMKITLRKKTPVVFTYRFEGEEESPYVTWKIPKP